MSTADAVDPRVKEMPKNRDRPSSYRGACYVVKDNIDTDQIIPAEYLTLVPSKVMYSTRACQQLGTTACLSQLCGSLHRRASFLIDGTPAVHRERSMIVAAHCCPYHPFSNM